MANFRRKKPRQQPCHKISSYDRVEANGKKKSRPKQLRQADLDKRGGTKRWT